MMEPEEIGVDGEILPVDFTVEIYLKNRTDPIHYFMTVGIPPVIETVAQLMQWAYSEIMSDVDSRSAAFLTFEDLRHNHFTVVLQEIQAVNILAPDQLPERFE